MNTYEIKGTVAKILDPQTFSSGFTKREFIVQTDEKYPQSIKFECVKERIAQLDPVREGATVNVSFRIRGSEYNGKFFVNLQALGVTVEGAGDEGADADDAGRIPREPEPEAEPEKEMPF
jgi:single-strand DNA-binding protein